MLAAVPLLTGMLPAPGGGGSTAAAARPPVPARQRPAPVYPVKPNTVKVPAMRAWHAPATRWPAAGTALVHLPSATARGDTAPLAGPSRGSARAGDLPVQVGPAAAAEPGSAPPSVTVSMRPRRAAVAAGVTGVLFTLNDSSRTGGALPIHVSLDYSSFEYADGGDYASRLHLVELPACVLTTPQRPACRVQTPVRSVDDVRASQLGADVSLPPAVRTPGRQAAAAVTGPAAGTEVVLAATTSTSGSGGDYTATPLSEAGTWAQAGSSGAFTYSYPIQVPPVPGGLEPAISLAYNSQLVDGLTSSTNGQASWIGDGWDYSPGYIERDYQSCGTEPPGATNWVKSGDFCWSSTDTTTLSLNGQDTTLVQDGATWRAEADGDEKISYQSGTSNGTHDGDYWVITEPDGTSYYFGLSELPGYASGDAASNSAWTMPVFATSSGQPCYKATFADSYCNQAWRWNLDYVTDPHGDAVAYFYDTETNNYSRDNGTTADASYTQAGALSTIEYGLRAGAVYGHTPAAEVTFKTVEDRTDVPTDLSCASNSSCDVISPTFWGKYQLTTISTQALEGSSLAGVDSWTLYQTYPSTGDPTTPAALWLTTITRKGEDTSGGGSSVPLPAVTFAGEPLANRVMTPADLNSGYSIITRFRLTSIILETGGKIGVAYETPGGACTSGNFPAPDANTALCYPDYWTPPGASGPIEDWFNKYVVTAATQTNTVGGGVAVQTSYSYAGAAWHYNDDSLIRSNQRTWDQWRGFRTVTTETGTSPDPVSETADTYFQGMNGDYQSGGGTSSVTLTSTRGATVTDSDQFAGMGFESIVYDGAGGSEVSDTITIPWTSAATATQSQPSPLPPLEAFLTGTAETRTYTPLASGGTRESDITYTHDSYGRVTSESDVPDTSVASETTCTTTTYASSTSAWILDLASEVQVVSVPCGTTPSLPADAVSDELTFYDGATSLSADTPAKGDVTQTRDATSYSGSAPAYTTESTATVDEYGRALTSTDADGRKTTTGYTPATGAEPTSVSVTDPMGLVTTTGYDPARDLPISVTDAAGYVTSQTYDGLGRLTAVWEPGHPKGSSPADYTYAYSVSDTAPSVVTTSTLNATGSYTVSETLYDSLGRDAETQAATPDGGRDITDIYYNSLGQKSLESNPYYTTGALSGTIVGAPDNQVPSQTGYVYDADGRLVRQIAYKLAKETSETDTAYDGNASTVSYKNLVAGQPTGGTPQTTFTDGRGLTSQIYQYHAGVSPSPSDPASGYDATSYTYTPAQKLATITDAAGNKWSYSYDPMGNQVSQADPDSGASHSVYDPAGQLMSTTDARGKTISYTYDGDGRKTAEYDTTGGALESSASEIASWTYDTRAKGMIASSSSYYGGQAYTEEVTGYNSYELPSGTETIIPSAQGALAGTYATGDTYDPDTMALSSYYDAAAGGLPAETVDIGYDTVGDPVSLGSSGSSGWSYAASLSYTEYGQPLQYNFGPSSSQVYVTDSYDEQTQLLTGSQVETGSNGAIVDATGYTYDNAGNVLSESDTPSGGPSQAQCFSYDYLGRLSQAWSQGSGSCAATPSASIIGGAQPYWEQLSYSMTGNITANNWTYGAPGAQSTVGYANTYPAPGSPGPHQLGSQLVTSSAYGYWTDTQSYDAAGHLVTATTPHQTESLSWDDAGRLSSLTVTPSGSGTGTTTSYLYDADGNLLLQEDPGSTTLYLGDEQLVLDTSTGGVTGTRYYAIGGTTVAARASSGTVDYLVGDREGTSLLSINATTQAVTRRYYGPFGAELDYPAATFPGDKGFVGGTTDTATGLTNLGAREYNPVAGQFISPDPLLQPYDPRDLNAYAYAADNPTTSEDPSGAMFCSGGGYCGGGVTVHDGHPAVSPGPAPEGNVSGYSDTGGPWYSPWGSALPPGLDPEHYGPAPPPPPRPVVKKTTNGSPSQSQAAAWCENETHTACQKPVPEKPGLLQRAAQIARYLGNPDYQQGCIGAYDVIGGGLCLARARDGSMYAGFQIGLGFGDFGPSFSQGYVGGRPTNPQVDNFVNGPSTGATGNVFAEGSVVNGNPPDLSWNNNDGFELGIASPGGAVWTSHMWYLPPWLSTVPLW